MVNKDSIKATYMLSLTSTDRKDSIYHSDTGSYRFVNFTS